MADSHHPTTPRWSHLFRTTATAISSFSRQQRPSATISSFFSR
ncbi:hypothetical protein M6B38_240245 [Iris pallida]|uniref:Uncharacterized protein n=1 Tax=Iris pallida TaxID=29817 RepID=A0AAX6DKA7_IRIPA|nr:hypothetical protein M6B38_240245 [Iris pallida]